MQSCDHKLKSLQRPGLTVLEPGKFNIKALADSMSGEISFLVCRWQVWVVSSWDRRCKVLGAEVQSQRLHTFQGRGMWSRNVREKKQKFKLKRQRQRIKLKGQLSEYWIFPWLFLICFIYSNLKGRKKARVFFTIIQIKNKVIASSIHETSINYILR